MSDLVCLGTRTWRPARTPGSAVDHVLSATPYAAPFARLGTLRSAGITDLRHGSITAPTVDGAHPTVPLPSSVRCYALAAHLGPATDHLKVPARRRPSCP